MSTLVGHSPLLPGEKSTTQSVLGCLVHLMLDWPSLKEKCPGHLTLMFVDHCVTWYYWQLLRLHRELVFKFEIVEACTVLRSSLSNFIFSIDVNRKFMFSKWCVKTSAFSTYLTAFFGMTVEMCVVINMRPLFFTVEQMLVSYFTFSIGCFCLSKAGNCFI